MSQRIIQLDGARTGGGAGDGSPFYVLNMWAMMEQKATSRCVRPWCPDRTRRLCRGGLVSSGAFWVTD